MYLPGIEITAQRQKVYPKKVTGKFRSARTLISFILQALLFITPWINYDGRQAILLDVMRRKIFLFGLVLHPQDTYLLHILLISAAITLFFVSALAGRMWCGYACPQTLFSQSFILIERWIEGDRAARMRLDKQPWDGPKFAKKIVKWSIWGVMGSFLGFTFAGYYMPIRGIAAEAAQGTFSNPTLIAMGLLTAISLFDFGYFREQFCCYLCPYARFQGALLDSNSMIVGYDSQRGEPRGKVKEAARGACIDCSACVQACPTGIDIRKGLQLECIACTACVDACDEMMDKVQQPRGLVRYTSLQELKGNKTRFIRPHVLIYGLILTGLISTFSYMVYNRTELEMDAVREVRPGGQVAATTPDGRFTNLFKINLINRTAHPQSVTVSVEGLQGAEILGITNPTPLASGEVAELHGILALPKGDYPRIVHFKFVSTATRVNDDHNDHMGSAVSPESKKLRAQKEATFVIP